MSLTDGSVLLGLAGIITAAGTVGIQTAVLIRTGKVAEKTDAIHTLVNSNLTEARDATLGRNQQNDALIRSNEMLATALAALSNERRETVAATLEASKAAIEVASAQQPPKGE